MAKHAHTTGAPRRRQSAAGADLFPQTGANPLSPTEAGIPALPVRRLRTAFYAAGHLLPIDFADRLALLERRERILDLAEALLDLADAMDAPLEDREPEPIEAEDDEAALQPVTLAPDWASPIQVRRTVETVQNCPVKPRRRSQPCKDAGIAPSGPRSLATGLRNACLAGTGFWVLVGLAGWGLA